ncbi:MAG TPA: phosphoribosylanthranilate isomerase [Anditalea sp.]|nr:phosphoribosylanthranilate isomerase [Anditalea sp.]
MLIKVCGLKDKYNVEEILSKQSPDLLGMIFYEKSQRFVGTKPLLLDRPISKDIPKVGVFVNSGIEHIIDMQLLFGFEWVQLHGDEDIAFIASLKDKIDIKVIKVFRVSGNINLDEIKPFEPLADYFLFDTQTTHYGGSGKQFDWKVLEEYNLDTPFILSGGIDIQHTEEILTLYRKNSKMAGVDINSKFELEPGLKDPDKVARFINAIRENTINQISYDRNR